jgi:hypothetical protein
LQDGSYNGHLLCSKWSQLNAEITIDDAEHDLQQLGVRNWRSKARDGVEWRIVVREAKVQLAL